MHLSRILIVWVCLSGCALFDGDGQAVAPEPVVVVTTDADTYALGSNPGIGIQVANTATEAVYYDTCGAVFLEELRAETVQKTWQLTFLRCYNIARLAPGQTAAFTLSPEALQADLEGLTLDGSVMHRLRLSAFYEDDRLATPLGEENQRSTPFTLLP